jgi:formylglycine-generating enzyme required for sulfatase activity
MRVCPYGDQGDAEDGDDRAGRDHRARPGRTGDVLQDLGESRILATSCRSRAFSWLDAARFCNSLSEREGLTPAYQLHADVEGSEWEASADGYRLPTEAEWEHACRAGTTGARYGQLDEIAWYRGNSDERIHDVGGKEPNPWGLHDMLGNVWQWCWDVYDAEVYATYRVLRGGGWYDERWSCRASVRRRSRPTFQIDDVGLRIARSRLS